MSLEDEHVRESVHAPETPSPEYMVATDFDAEREYDEQFSAQSVFRSDTRTEQVRNNPEGSKPTTSTCMPTLDVREIPPPERHPKIHDTFAEMDSGEVLEIVNDHDPKPLFYEMQAEVESFDADDYEVAREGDQKFVARFPKR